MSAVDLDLVDDQPGLETYRNMGRGGYTIKRFGEKRGRYDHEHIRGGAVFDITPEERRINERAILHPSNNPWANGTFLALHLKAGERDTAKIEAAQEGLQDDDLAAMLKLNAATFKKRVAEVPARLTVARLLQMALDADAPASKVTAIQERLNELHPNASQRDGRTSRRQLPPSAGAHSGDANDPSRER